MVCPNCSAETPAGAAECPKCSIVFAKWRGRSEAPRQAAQPQAGSFPWLPLVAGLGLAAAGAAYVMRSPPAAPAAAPAPVAQAATPVPEPAPDVTPPPLAAPALPATRPASLAILSEEALKAKAEAWKAQLNDPEAVKRREEEAKRRDEAAHDRVMSAQGYYKSATTGNWEKYQPGQYNPK